MEKIDENAIIERIKQLRTQHAGNRGKSRFAQALGISPSTYSYYETNRVPPIDIILNICQITGADLYWLLTGQTRENDTVSNSGVNINSQNTSLLRKIDALLTQNSSLTIPINAFVDLLSAKNTLENQITPIQGDPNHSNENKLAVPDRPGWIPLLGRTAAGMVHFWDQQILPEPKQAVTELDELVKKHTGKSIISSTNGTVSVDLAVQGLIEGVKNAKVNLVQVSGDEQGQIVEFIQCEDIFKLFPDSFALQIDGDSMAPRINDGDIVILSPSVPAGQGQIAVARVANQIGVTCKLIRTTDDDVHLIPINERYETKVVGKEDLLWALAVLCHITI